MSDNFDSQQGTYEVDINSPEFGESGSKSKIKAIANAGQALKIAERLVEEDERRDAKRSRVLAAFNGSAPYSDSLLRSKAQSYRYNVSFGFLEGVIGRGVVPYNDLTLNIDNLAEIDADLPDIKMTVLREEFARIIKDWGKWPKFISQLNQELVLNGYDTAIFPSYYDPFPVFVPQNEGFVHEGTLNDVNDLDVFVWKKNYLIHQLYQNIENTDIAKKSGWNVDNVRKSLEDAAPDDLLYSSNAEGRWQALEQAIRGGSLYSSLVGSKVVETYHVFASEIDGPVTHYVVLARNYNIDNKDSGDGVELFKKERQFPSFKEMLVYFDLEPGDGKWHGSRGLGRRSYNTHSAIDKLRCAILDQAFTSGLTLLQAGDQLSQEEFQLSVIGPFAVIPAGTQISSTALPALSGTSFQADSLLASTSEQRIGDAIPNVSSTFSQEPRTATEARIAANRQALIGKGNLQRYLDPISQLLSIMFRRLIAKNSTDESAKKFQERIMKRGVTEEDLRKVRGVRSSGRIDDVLGENQQNTAVVFAEFRGDPDINQLELKRRRISSVIGAKDAQDLIITPEDQTKQIEAVQKQEVELGAIYNGFPMPVSPRDPHPIHLQVLMSWIDGQIQTLGQGQPGAGPQELQGALEHAGMHVAAMQQDPQQKNAAKKLESDLRDAAKTIQRILQNNQKQKELQIQNLQEQAAMAREAQAVPSVPAVQPTL